MRELVITEAESERETGESRETVMESPVIFVVMQTGKHANGGVESVTRVIENVRRVRPLVVTQIETPVNERWRAAGCEVRVWPGAVGKKLTRTASLARANLRMFRLVRETGCRIVHCNDILSLWHTAFGARAAGARVVFNVRNIKPAAQAYGLRWRVARRISDRQLVLSKEMREALTKRLGVEREGRSASSIEYIYSMTDQTVTHVATAEERAAARERMGMERDCFAVGYVAAFDPRKGQLEFIENCLRPLKEVVPSLRVFFLGDFQPDKDEYARRCIEQVEREGLARHVSFVGYVRDVSEWYRALDLVVVASRNEGLARCMIESIACGTPVVSFDVCSATEILKGHDCGEVVPHGDYKALTEGVARLARDGVALRRLGDNGIRAASVLFEPSRVAAQYEQLYFSLLQPQSGE